MARGRKRGSKIASRLVPGSNAHRIWCALRKGAETAADIEVDLNFTLSRHLIAGHLSNLKKSGWVRVIGEVPSFRQDGQRGSNAHRYLAQRRVVGADYAVVAEELRPVADELRKKMQAGHGIERSSDK